MPENDVSERFPFSDFVEIFPFDLLIALYTDGPVWHLRRDSLAALEAHSILGQIYPLCLTAASQEAELGF